MSEYVRTDSKALPRVTYSNVGADFSGLHAHLDGVISEIQQQVIGKDLDSFVGGEDRPGHSRFEVRSPIDRDLVLGRFTDCDPSMLEAAVAAARKASPAWEQAGWKGRVALLRRAADVVNDRKYTLAAACLLEVGKSRLEAMGEVEEAADIIRYYADQMENADGYYLKAGEAVPGERGYSLLRPHGVFAVIAPFNFPVALSIGMMTAALLAGNTVVFKPNDMSSLTGRLIADCFIEAGLPSGVLNLVYGGANTGAALAAHGDVDGIAFTGSNAVGMQLLRANVAGPAAKPVLAEMGGKNPAFVTADADLDIAAEGVMRSAFGLQGQKCSALSKVYVAGTVQDAFLDKLLNLTARLEIGDPRRRNVFLGPVINEAAAERYSKVASLASADGKVLAGGRRLDEGTLAKGIFVAPTVVTGLAPDHLINQAELFLPFLSVLAFDDLGEAIRISNSSAFGLTAGIYTASKATLDVFLNSIEAGVLYANRASGATTGAWPGFQTFCGWKGSGTTGKGGLGPWYVPQFMREQSVTLFGNPANP